MGVEVGSAVGADKAAPFWGIVPGVAVVQAGIFVVVVTTIADRVSVRYSRIAGNGAVAPGIVDVLSDQSTAGVVNAHNIAQRIPVEIVGTGHTAGGILHADDGVAVSVILPLHFLAVKNKPPRSNVTWEASVFINAENYGLVQTASHNQ